MPGCHNASACPVTSMKEGPNSGLKFLSSRQALADLSNFHRQAVEKYSLTDANKVAFTAHNSALCISVSVSLCRHSKLTVAVLARSVRSLA